MVLLFIIIIIISINTKPQVNKEVNAMRLKRDVKIKNSVGMDALSGL